MQLKSKGPIRHSHFNLRKLGMLLREQSKLFNFNFIYSQLIELNQEKRYSFIKRYKGYS